MNLRDVQHFVTGACVVCYKDTVVSRCRVLCGTECVQPRNLFLNFILFYFLFSDMQRLYWYAVFIA